MRRTALYVYVTMTFILSATLAFGQGAKKSPPRTTPPPPVIQLLPGGHEVAAYKAGAARDEGFRAFLLPLVLKGKADKDQVLSLRILNYEAPSSLPSLIPASVKLTIPKGAFGSGEEDTRFDGIVTVRLRQVASLPENEKAFIIKEGDDAIPFTLVILRTAVPKTTSTTAAQPATDTTKDTTGKTGAAGKPGGAGKTGASGKTGVGEKPGTTKTADSTEDTDASTPDGAAAADSSKKTDTLVTLVNTDTTLHPVISGETLKSYPTIKLLFHLSGAGPKDPFDITLELKPLNAGIVSPDLQTKKVTFQPEDWTHKDKEGNVEKEVTVELSSVETFGRDVSFFIIVKDKPEKHNEVRISTIGLYNPNKPFWVEVGANFDFADGLKPNNFFGGVFLHKRDIRPFSFRKPDSARCARSARSSNLGIFAGVYESKTISDVNIQDFGLHQYYNNSSIGLKRNDSLGVFEDSGKVKTTQVVKNIGLFFSPQVRLTNGSANADGLHLSASLWFELQWQRLSTKVDYSNQIRMDTLYYPRSDLAKVGDSLSISQEKDIRSHYWGVGLPIYFKEGDANVYFNPVIGISNQPSEKEISSILTQTEPFSRKWRMFYIFQFRLNEERYGIAFTGEVRGLIIHNSRPFVSLALTKKFDLSKFMEFK